MERMIQEINICSDILRYGKDILKSDVFRQAAGQKHHHYGTVLEHTINVCVVSLRLACQLENRGIAVCKKDLVHAGLCHDLGLVDRDNKYKTRIEAWKNHPQESAKIARELVPDMTPEAEDMILSHMWPIAGPPPGNNEGMLLCMADKYSSMSEWKKWLTDYGFAARILGQLD